MGKQVSLAALALMLTEFVLIRRMLKRYGIRFTDADSLERFMSNANMLDMIKMQGHTIRAFWLSFVVAIAGWMP